MAARKKLNGSVDDFASAMRNMLTEAVEGAVEGAIDPLRKDMKDMEARLNKRIDTQDKNMQVQFAEQEKKIARIMRERRA